MDIIIRPDEKIIKTFRTYRRQLNAIIFWLLLAVGGLASLRAGLKFNFGGYWQYFLGAVIAIFFFWFLIKWTIWRGRRLIVSNQRVLYINREGIFNKIVTEILLKDIEEVSFQKKGMGAMFSNYGTVRIKTEADDDLVIYKMPNPQDVMDTINKTRQQP